MKITTNLIKEFEREQEEFGTETAIHNVLFNVATELLRDLGCAKISTSINNKKEIKNEKTN